MPRIKWLEVLSQVPLDVVANEFSKREYRKGRTTVGFDLRERNKQRIGARFIREERVSEIDVDPLGVEFTREYVRYIYIDFSLTLVAGKTLLRLSSPPRSLRDFISEFARAFDHDMALKEIDLDVGDLVSKLKTSGIVGRAKTRSAVFSEVPLTEHGRAKIVVTSSKDAVRDFRTRLSGGKLEKIIIEFRHSGGAPCALEFSSKASLRFDNDAVADDLDRIERLIADQIPLA
jgi:hypothetical protein